MAGSGKTTLCGQIIAASSVNAVRLDCDRFSTHSHTERQALIAEARRSGIAEHMAFIENPMNWYSFDHILAALDDLKNKRIHTHDRAWNRETGELDGRYQVRIAEDGPALILCDCIYLLHPAVRTALDLVVLVETPAEIVAERGLQRSKGDAARAAVMESLRRTYSVPYFETFGSRADIVYQAET
ncbi:hypothetical protein ACO34A_06920 [Rhizobium sp. ACO-34A]|nr:hypothetical protein ACO34A_06920 [Rhizobium sp. ACO-34A]